MEFSGGHQGNRVGADGLVWGVDSMCRVLTEHGMATLSKNESLARVLGSLDTVAQQRWCRTLHCATRRHSLDPVCSSRVENVVKIAAGIGLRASPGALLNGLPLASTRRTHARRTRICRISVGP